MCLYWPFLVIDAGASGPTALFRSAALTCKSLHRVGFQFLFTVVTIAVCLAGFVLAIGAFFVAGALGDNGTAFLVLGLIAATTVICFSIPVVVVAAASAYRTLTASARVHNL
jgi:hypothetical protein